jgi:hypothetical protein
MEKEKGTTIIQENAQSFPNSSSFVRPALAPEVMTTIIDPLR